MKSLNSIRDLNLEGRAVFLRLDLNVPMQDGVITSDARIQAALPTIRYAMERGARLALASHLGRPKGKRDPQASLDPVGMRLSELLDCEVILADDCIGDGVKGLLQRPNPDSVILLENLRYHAGEESEEMFRAVGIALDFFNTEVTKYDKQ